MADITLERGSRSHVGHLRVNAGEHNLLSPASVKEFHSALDALPEDVSVLTIQADDSEQHNQEAGSIPGLSAGLHLGESKDLPRSESVKRSDALTTYLEHSGI